MPSQLVAAATQLRKASGLDDLEELLDEELPEPHIPISASRQLPLPFELVLDVDVAKHVPHLAMMLSTALSHFTVVDGHPVTHRTENTNPRNARFMAPPNN
jgi:hypothetical protein